MKYLSLFLLIPNFIFCNIVPVIFDYPHLEVERIYKFCELKKTEYELQMQEEKKVQIYLVYRSKRDAYIEIINFINLTYD